MHAEIHMHSCWTYFQTFYLSFIWVFIVRYQSTLRSPVICVYFSLQFIVALQTGSTVLLHSTTDTLLYNVSAGHDCKPFIVSFFIRGELWFTLTGLGSGLTCMWTNISERLNISQTSALCTVHYCVLCVVHINRSANSESPRKVMVLLGNIQTMLNCWNLYLSRLKTFFLRIW